MTETVAAQRPAARPLPTLSSTASFVASAATLASLFLAAGAPSPLLPIYEAAWGFAPWLLTLAFGVYAIALLAALLTIGALSDHLGRRPVLIAAVGVQLVALVVFLLAPSVGWLLVGRVLQGVSVGAAAGAFGAAVVEHASERRKRLAAVLVSAAPTGGLALGALFSGLIAQFTAAPAFTVWLTLVVVAAVGTALTVFSPETTTPAPGAIASLRPRVTVPARAARAFAATAPVNVAAWLTAALFLGLVPTVLRQVFALPSPLDAGLAAAVAFGTAAVAAIASARLDGRRVMLIGTAAVGAGAVFFVGSVLLGAFPLLWVGAFVGGAGIGGAFSGTIRSLIPGAHPHERAGLFAAIYVVSYLALGVPAIVAGLFLAPLGATVVAVAYGVVIVAVAAIGIATHRSGVIDAPQS